MKRNRFFQGLGTLFSNSLSKFSLAIVALFAFSAQANAQCVIPAGTTQSALSFDPSGCGGTVIVNGTLEMDPVGPFFTIDWESFGPINLRIEGVGAFLSYPGGGVKNLRLATGSTVVLANGGRFLEDPTCPASERIFIGGALWATCNGGGAPFSFPQLNGLAEELEVPGAFTASVSSNSICFENALTLTASSTVGGATLSWAGSGPGSYTFSSVSANPTIAANTFTVAGTYTFTARVTNTLGFYSEQSFTVEVAEVCSPISVINAPDHIFICNNSTRVLTANFGQPVVSYQWFRNGQPIAGANSSNFSINKWSLGRFFVRAVTSGGATLNSEVINVNRFDILDASGDSPWGIKFCPGGEVQLFGPEMSGATYEWTIGTLGGPAVETNRVFEGQYLGGTYNMFLKVTTSGCMKHARTSIIPENSSNCEVEEFVDPVRPEASAKTATEFFGNDVALTFYPNPVRGNYKINLSGLAQDETFNVSWFDLTGKQVLATTISTGTGTVVENSINNLSKGLYLVQVNNANHNFTFKVMVD